VPAEPPDGDGLEPVRILLAPATLAEVTGHHAKVESARAGCNPAIWERASAEGRAMSLDETADYALSSG
jgi:hypothetical protein